MAERAGVPPDQRRTQRAIVFQLLRDDHEERWTRDELAEEVKARPAVLDAALAILTKHGVVVIDADAIRAAAPARHLDALGVIGV